MSTLALPATAKARAASARRIRSAAATIAQLPPSVDDVSGEAYRRAAARLSSLHLADLVEHCGRHYENVVPDRGDADRMPRIVEAVHYPLDGGRVLDRPVVAHAVAGRALPAVAARSDAPVVQDLRAAIGALTAERDALVRRVDNLQDCLGQAAERLRDANAEADRQRQAAAERQRLLADAAAARDALAERLLSLRAPAGADEVDVPGDTELLQRIGLVEIPEGQAELAAAARGGSIYPVASKTGTIRAYGRTRTLFVVAGRTIRIDGPTGLTGDALFRAAWWAICGDLDFDPTLARHASARGMIEARRLWCFAVVQSWGMTLSEAVYFAERIELGGLPDPPSVSYHVGTVRRRLDARPGASLPGGAP